MHYFATNFLLLLLLIQAFSANCCIEHERDALLEFKAGVNDLSSRLASWRGKNCCNWAGIRCSNQTGHVVKLNLRNTNFELDEYGDFIFDWNYHSLTGKISPSLLFLSDLKHLDLSFNNFSGIKFPKFIVAFRNLKYLNLSNTGLHGKIPPQLGNLSRLLYFDLSYYPYISDFILSTDTWWLSNLRSLKHMDMSAVVFKDSNGWVETLNKISTLEVLVLSWNNLTQISNAHTLVNLTSLRVFHISSQNFNTTIPKWVGNLTSITYLRLRENYLSGTIPIEFGNLTNLVHLDLGSNSLTGILSETHLTSLLKLKKLLLDGNNITILLDSDWRPFFQLKSITLSVGKLGPKFPAWLKRQVEIQVIFLPGVGIDDIIPDWLWSLSSLESLDLSYNKLRGKLPANLVHMTKLFEMDLSYNLLEGKIPFLPTSIAFLDLSSNSLSGYLPPCWSNISRVIDLANNRFSGVVPSSVSCSVTLKVLKLGNNTLTGEFPFDLQFCRELQMLDLGENNFHGIIPDWVGESLQQLQFLRLQSNLFSGNIPSKLTQLNNLRVLDLSNNHLSGPLPRGLDNFTSMSQLFSLITIYYDESLNEMTKGLILDYDPRELLFWKSMDLSNNNLIGDIPPEIVVLTALVNLNLSHNHLIGNIPLEIGNMTSLESFDLHMNNLSGIIPQSISTLYSLAVLNFSYNNLSGSIPTGHQLQALDDPSIYSGNPYLCGPPLGSSCGSSERFPQSDGNNDSYLKNTGERDKWLYLFIEFGFMTGFLAVFFTLLFKIKWKYTYFQIVDSVFHRLYVMGILTFKRLIKEQI